MGTPTNDGEARRRARAHLDEAQRKLSRLTEIDPFFIDLSLRENPVGARVGQTLDEKLQILPLVREFGFQNVLLGTLDYSMPDELEVDDDFMMYLRDHGIDMTGGFAFTDIGIAAPDGSFAPSPSMRKLSRLPRAQHPARDLPQPRGDAGALRSSDAPSQPATFNPMVE
jgi:hypothetical protein